MGTTEAETCDIGIGQAGDMRGRAVRQRVISAMCRGQFYASTGVTITSIGVEGDRITVETTNAERLVGSIDHGEVVARVEGRTLTFRVPPRATYARVTASRGEGDHHIDGEQFAWTQPFWVSVGGAPKSTDPRFASKTKLTGWQRLQKLGAAAVARELYREEAVANLRGRRHEAEGGLSSQGIKMSTNERAREVKEYYDTSLPTYQRVWGDDGRVSWGFFDNATLAGGCTDRGCFKAAQERQMTRLAEMGGIDENSVVLDFGCGTAVNAFYLVRKYGCRVVGLDTSHAMIRKARSTLAREKPESFDRVSLYFGTLEELASDLHQLYADKGGGEQMLRRLLGDAADIRAPFTHVWSTNVLWYLPEEERAAIFSRFAAVSIAGVRLVVDDCLSRNRVVSHRSQVCLYDRLFIERLWSPELYKRKLQADGFEIDVFEDLSPHCKRSYEFLAKVARKRGFGKLAADYDGTVHAIEEGDCAWFAFIATHKPQ